MSQGHSNCSYSQFNNGCLTGCISAARDVAKNSKSNEEQTKTNISKKLHNLWQHKKGTNTLIKLIRLMEATGRFNFIRTGASDLVFWNLRFMEMVSLNKKWYHWSKYLSKIGNLHMFWTSKNAFFFPHHLSGRTVNSEQFDSILLVCAYKLVDSVVSHGKYEDKCSFLTMQV